jgi:curved DNA-binding protein CbpA
VTDPTDVLGVAPNAGEEEIRAAYLRKVQEYPPDKAPDEFEMVRNAYEILRDPRKRTLAMLHASDPNAPLTSLLDGRAPRRLFAGPQPWREVLKAK